MYCLNCPLLCSPLSVEPGGQSAVSPETCFPRLASDSGSVMRRLSVMRSKKVGRGISGLGQGVSVTGGSLRRTVGWWDTEWMGGIAARWPTRTGSCQQALRRLYGRFTINTGVMKVQRLNFAYVIPIRFGLSSDLWKPIVPRKFAAIVPACSPATVCCTFVPYFPNRISVDRSRRSHGRMCSVQTQT